MRLRDRGEARLLDTEQHHRRDGSHRRRTTPFIEQARLTEHVAGHETNRNRELDACFTFHDHVERRRELFAHEDGLARERFHEVGHRRERRECVRREVCEQANTGKRFHALWIGALVFFDEVEVVVVEEVLSFFLHRLHRDRNLFVVEHRREHARYRHGLRGGLLRVHAEARNETDLRRVERFNELRHGDRFRQEAARAIPLHRADECFGRLALTIGAPQSVTQAVGPQSLSRLQLLQLEQRSNGIRRAPPLHGSLPLLMELLHS